MKANQESEKAGLKLNIQNTNIHGIQFHQFSSVQSSHSVVSESLWPHGLQHARPPCPSSAPRVIQTHVHWVGDAIQPSNLLLSLLPPSIIPSIRIFSNESILCIRRPKYWSFSFNISHSNEYSGLISFRMNWLDLLAVWGTLKYSPTPQFKSINSLALSFLYSPTLTSIHDYWKNHSID